MTVSFGVLGPLTADRDDDGPVPLRGNRQRAVLARLLVANGRVVPVGTLVDDLWPDDPPDRAVASIRTFVADLRRALEPGRTPRQPSQLLVTAPPGYALHASGLDARRFADTVLDVPPDPADALARLDHALALWRGPAYAEFAAEGWARAEIDRLDELRALAVERRAQALLDLDRAADAAPPLQAHVTDHPLREEAWALLATALYRAGRQGDALAALRRARDLLAEQLGVNPGTRLRALESDILSQATHLDKHQDPAGVRPHSPPAPASNAPPARSPSAPPAATPQHPDRAAVVVAGTSAGQVPAGQALGQASNGQISAGQASASQISASQISAGQASGDQAFVGQVAAGRDFVGRDEERRWLAEAAGTAVSRRRPVLALISGDAGAGKTALAEALARALTASGWTTVWGRCPEYEGAPVAWPWLQITDALSAATRGSTGERAGEHRDTDPAAARFRLRRATSALVQEATRAAPALIVLDDLHWADEGTLDLLAGLLTGPDAVDGPVLAVGTYRATEITPELGAALARFARTEPVRVYLGGLPAGETGDLAATVTGQELAPDVVTRLHRRTGGNPFFVRELARVLAAEGPGALEDVPAGVRDVIRHRLTRLPAPARTLLHRAAVLGRDVDPAVLAVLAGLEDDTLLEALEQAVSAGLLTEHDGRLRFTHILVRDTVYGDLSALRRARWHAAAGAALERSRPDDAAALAHHFALAGADDAPRAARYARIAAERAERGGNPHEAVRMWQLAVDAHDRATTGRGAGAQTGAQTGAQHMSAGSTGAQPMAAQHKGTVSTAAQHTGLGSMDAQHMGPAGTDAQHAGTGGAGKRLAAMMGLGRALAVAGRLDEARRHRADAIEAAGATGGPEAVAVALTSFDVPAVWPRNDDEELSARIVAAAERVLAAWDGAERDGAGAASGDRAGSALLAGAREEPGRTVAGFSGSSAAGRWGLRSRLLSTMALELRGRTDDRGEVAARAAERLAREAGEPALLAFALNARFMHCFGRAGLAAERAAIGSELVEVAARHRLVTYEVLGHLVLLQASCARGDTDAADRHAADLDRLAARYELPVVEVFTGWYAGLRHAVHGELGAAETAYRAAAARMAGRGMPGMEEGLLPLALFSLGGDVPPDGGPYEPWVRPARLIRDGRRDEARAALREIPASPRDLLLEARLWLVARAAAELGEEDVLARAREALRPADGELAGGGSGVLSFGRISVAPPEAG